MPISSANFQYICTLARDEAAIVLETGKEYLVESRLSVLAQREGFSSLDDFVNKARQDRATNGVHNRIIDALTTNETLFFRDFHPFEAMRQHLIPKLIEQRAGLNRLTIWSAACSTGQEPYSLAMLIREHFPQLANWQILILATDLSPTTLEQARQGSYSQIEVNRGLPASYLIKYFSKQGDRWVVKDDLRRMVDFRPMNLIKPWPIIPSCDIIMLRNVMIYFDVETKKSILKRVRQCLQPAGYFFLGTAETTVNLDTAFKPVTLGKAVAYQI